MAILEVHNLNKQYPPPPRWARPLVRVASRTAVDAIRDASFHVDVGEVVGLVGPNGAGKSTLIRLVAGLLEPSGGRVLVNGRDAAGSRRSPSVGLGLILEGDRGLYSRLTGSQNLAFFGVISGLRRNEALRRSAELMEMFDLAGRDKLVFGYSSGMRLRLSLARALMAEPPLLLLDEPTRSLDPLASVETGKLLRALADRGHAILVANHRLDEVVTVCDRVVAIVDGRVRYAGAPSLLLDAAGTGAQAALLELLAQTDGSDT